MLLGDRFQIFAQCDSHFDIVFGKWIAAKRGVENIISRTELGNAGIFAAEGIKLRSWRYKHCAIDETVSFALNGFGNNRCLYMRLLEQLRTGHRSVYKMKFFVFKDR